MAQYDYTGYETAFVNSPMGGYGADPYLELEEERRRREEEERRRQEEAASQVVQSQQVQTRADGSQTITTKTQRPGRSMAFGNVAGPVDPNMPGAPRIPGAPGINDAVADDESSARKRAAVAMMLGVPTEFASAGGPVDLFRKIVGAESGGQHTDARGNILTSPKGAQGIAQIMPQTAAAPGFGIKPATPQEIATPEGNLAFGGRYLQGMLDLFGGDQVKAAAAYNAGPGRVKQAEQLAAQRGGSFMDYLPRETMNYIGKIFGSMIPSAQAGTLPPTQRQPLQPAVPDDGSYAAAEAARFARQGQPVEPVVPVEPPVVAQAQAPVPGAPVAITPSSISAAPDTVTAQGQPAPNSFDEFGTPVYSAAQEQLDRQVQAYTSAQGNLDGLLGIANDPNARDWIRTQAKNDAADLLVQERERKRAEAELTKMTPQQIGRELSRPSKDEGSWLKYTLFAALRIEPLMQAEGIKLGIYDKTQYIKDENGRAYQVRVGGDGTIKSGIDAATGQPMTDEQLIKAGGMVSTLNQQKSFLMPQTSGAPVTKTIDGKLVNGIQIYDPVSKSFYVQYGNKRDMNPEGWTSATQNVDLQRVQQLQKTNIQIAADWEKLKMRIAGAAPEKYNEEIGKFSAMHPNVPVTLQSLQGPAPQFDVTTGQLVSQPPAQAAPAQAAPAQAAPAAVAQPVRPVAPAAPAAGAAPAAARPVTPGEFLSQRTQEEERRRAALEVGTAEEKDYVTKTKPEIGQTSSDGLAVSNARRQQLDIIRRNPSIINIMNGQGSTYDQARRIIINAVSGAYGQEERQQLATDLGQVLNKLTEAEQGALQEFVNLNTVVNAKTLRANAGPGAVSDAEQRANKEANVGNVDRIPAYAALAGLYRSQFNGDLAASKQAFMAANPQFKTTGEFNTAWQRQEALRLKEYQAIAKARFDIMGRAPAPNAGPEAIAAYRDRVFRAFEAYPAPTFDASTGKWNYQTANARRAAMAAVLGQ